MSIDVATRPVTVTVPVQWGDQDALGHVNNTVYLRWFESGRIALFDSLGFVFGSPAGGVYPVLASATVHFRRPITFPATVVIHSSVTRTGRTSLTMEHRVRVAGEEADAADGSSVVVLVDPSTNRPHPLPGGLLEAIGRAARAQ
jgi:acyl-CoA thioester hydrolase